MNSKITVPDCIFMVYIIFISYTVVVEAAYCDTFNPCRGFDFTCNFNFHQCECKTGYESKNGLCNKIQNYCSSSKECMGPGFKCNYIKNRCECKEGYKLESNSCIIIFKERQVKNAKIRVTEREICLCSTKLSTLETALIVVSAILLVSLLVSCMEYNKLVRKNRKKAAESLPYSHLASGVQSRTPPNAIYNMKYDQSSDNIISNQQAYPNPMHPSSAYSNH